MYGRRRGKKRKLADKPGSVVGSHSSRRPVARTLWRPTREQREPRYRSPIWPCSGWGLPCRLRYRKRGALLPHLFTLTSADSRLRFGGLFSVALSMTSRSPAVNRHPALWSPDFPLREHAAQRLPSQLHRLFYQSRAGKVSLSCDSDNGQYNYPDLHRISDDFLNPPQKKAVRAFLPRR